ncbi:MAG: 5'-nucleotidase C-terminal domain-containing protein [Chloroflexi bacterium]|nr:5'-nucleotidase C-terminal domain-containing protein [Chloroflexota bacterium]
MRRILRFALLCLLVLAAVAGALVAPAAAQGGEYRLTVLHTGENHGHWDSFTQTISLGGIARRATLIRRVRAEGGNVLALDSGDVSQGTLYFTQHRMAEGAAFYNAAGYDVVGIGNHEFDLGPRTFAENWVANARFGIVSTNLDFSAEPLLAGKLPPFMVKTIGGEPVGILGFTTEDVTFSSSMGPTIRVRPRVESARAAVAQLQAQGVNKIVAVSHLGYGEDIKLAAAVDGIALIVGGHTPTLLGDPARLNPALGAPVGPYPTVIRSPGGRPVLLVAAGEWGKLLGRIDVTFDATGAPVKWSGEPILVDAGIPDDPAVEALRQQLAAPLTTARQTVIGKAASDLDGSARLLRSQEAPIGNLVADAMLDAARADGAQVALMNGGGIRTGFKAGDITLGQVLEALPFGNRLVQLDVNGADLLAVLENGVSRISDGAGRFPQVAGLRFAFSLTRPAGQRVTAVEIGSAAAGFKPLDPAATYRIVTNDFMAGGGDGYEMLKNGTAVRGGDVPVDSVVAEYIRARGTVSPRVEGRIANGALSPAPTAVIAASGVLTSPTVPPAATIVTPTVVVTPTAMPAPAALASNREPVAWYVIAALLMAALLLGAWVARRRA